MGTGDAEDAWAGEEEADTGGDSAWRGAFDSWVERGAVHDSVLSGAPDAAEIENVHFEYGDLSDLYGEV